jgi:hypothetical protein
MSDSFPEVIQDLEGIESPGSRQINYCLRKRTIYLYGHRSTLHHSTDLHQSLWLPQKEQGKKATERSSIRTQLPALEGSHASRYQTREYYD